MILHMGTKAINAAPMTRLTYNELRGWTLPEDEDGTDEGYLVEYLTGGEPNHPDYTGYISWSPKAVFESSYTSNGHFSFGDAVLLMKQGCKVARAGWNGAGMFAYYVPAAKYKACTDIMTDMAFADNLVPYREYLALKTAQGDIATWSPSTSDALANDWEIVA